MMEMYQAKNALKKRCPFGLKRDANACRVLFLLLFFTGCNELGTTYAPGYSEQGFSSIKVGDTKAHVISVLGEPLRIVGNGFIYSYFGEKAWFMVDTETGKVSISTRLGAQSDEKRRLYEGIKTIDELTKTLGAPDKISRAHRGQSNNPEVWSYVYSEEKGHAWKVRVVFVHKISEKVVDKWAYNMTD